MDIKDVFITNSQIPKRYLIPEALVPKKSDESVFEQINNYKEHIVEHISKGDNLLIYSHLTGNGKTSWATKIGLEAINKWESINTTNDYPVLFVNLSTFFNKKRMSISNPYYQPEVQTIEKNVFTARLVIFDDIASRGLTAFEQDQLYCFVDYRTSNMLSSIFTSNAEPTDLAKILDGRTYDRITSYSELAHITDVSNRHN